MSTNIKAILFDLDGTLYQHLPRNEEAFADYVQRAGHKVSMEDRVRAEHWTHFYFASSLEIRSDQQAYADEKSFWLNFTRRRLVALGIKAADAAELAPRVAAHMEETHKPISFVPQDAFDLLQVLKAAGYVMGVVSNREKPFWEKLIDLKLDMYFKFALASAEVNSYKPDRRIFEKALELSGTSAAETMYVGDNYFADVVGARRAGIVPVLYDPYSLFHEPGCAVIKTFGEVSDLLK